MQKSEEITKEFISLRLENIEPTQEYYEVSEKIQTLFNQLNRALPEECRSILFEFESLTAEMTTIQQDEAYQVGFQDALALKKELGVMIPEENKVVSKKLIGLMIERGVKAGLICERLKIPKKSLALKINGQLDWEYRELISIIKLFGFSEVRDVFPELYDSILTVN